MTLDLFWVLIATVLVFVMQTGFACLEAGLVRSKNTINVVMKNILDLCVAAILFWLIGFGLMFGLADGGLVGLDSFAIDAAADPEKAIFLLFQLMFCAAAVTIISGAVAERMKLAGYLIASAVVAVFIYPVYGHWVWGGALTGEPGWLAGIGFVDFAGSTVVHSIGGWCALAAILVIGPRAGRYDGDPMEPHSLLFTMLGVMLLWFGWFGFNGGSALVFDGSVPIIILNTLIAPAAGALAAFGLDVAQGRRLDVPRGLNAVIGGLVGVTAGAHAFSTFDALLVGAVGGMIAARGGAFLDRMQIDDAVGAVPAHLFAGIWGTLAVALFGDREILGTGLGFLPQLIAQMIGVVTAGLFALGVMFPLMLLAHRRIGLRVSDRSEALGLNIAEHGASTALQTLIQDMDENKATGDFSRTAEIEQGGDYALIAEKYNQVLERVRREVSRRESALRDASAARAAAEQAAEAKSRFLAHMSHELRTPLNAIIGFSELLGSNAATVDTRERMEYAGAIGESGKHLLKVINDILEYSRVERQAIALREDKVSLDAILHSTIRMLTPLAEQRGIRLTLDRRTAADVLNGDEKLLKQTLINIASNAVKFAEDHGRVRIGVELEWDGRLAVSVCDDGPGIPPDQYDLALQPFRQTGDVMSRPQQEGAGLGLPLSQSFIKLHDGTLTLSPAEPNGLCVTLRLPAIRVLDAPDRIAAAGQA